MNEETVDRQGLVTVRQLIEALQKMPPEKKIILSVADGADRVWVRDEPQNPWIVIVG